MKLAKYVLLVVFLICVSFLLTGYYHQHAVSTLTRSESNVCNARVEIGDITSDNLSEYVLFCGDRLLLGLGNSDTINGDLRIESVDSFYDLFYFPLHDKKDPINDPRTLQEVTIFPKSNPKFIGLVGLYDGVGTMQSSLGVYILTNEHVKQVFKRGFEEIQGRWTNISFLADSPEIEIQGDQGNIGCNGCRMSWIDFFVWNSQRGIFLLNNTSHKQAYASLFQKYKEMDQKGCDLSVGHTKTYHLQKSLTQLLEDYPTESMYCDDKAGISKESLERFFQVKGTIQAILDGENLSVTKTEEEACVSSSECISTKCLVTDRASTQGVCMHQLPIKGCFSFIEDGKKEAMTCI